MKTTVAIVGGGIGGTTTASYLARAGVDSVIVEKATFPRFRVGEGLTGEVGQIIRELGLEPDMDRIGFAVKTGACVVGTSGKNTFTVAVRRRDAALGLCDTTTWQVRRSTFDQLMLERALGAGVSLVNGRAVEPVVEDGVVRGVGVEVADGRTERIESDVVVDASGPATFLARAGVASRREPGRYDRQLSVYSHFGGATFGPEPGSRNAHILYQRPYHWGWYIPMGGDAVSIGVVTPAGYFRDRGEGTGEFLRRELRELNPGMAERTAGLDMIEGVHVAANFSYHVRRFCGPGFVCVGDAHRFIDPIFAFGAHFAMVEGKRAAATIVETLADGGPAAPAVFEEHQRVCELGIDTIQDLVDGFWSNPFGFAVLAHQRYRDDFTDLFAGRVYQDEPSPGLQALRRLTAASGGRHPH